MNHKHPGRHLWKILVKPPRASFFDQLEQTKRNIKLQTLAQFPFGIAILKIEGQNSRVPVPPPVGSRNAKIENSHGTDCPGFGKSCPRQPAPCSGERCAAAGLAAGLRIGGRRANTGAGVFEGRAAGRSPRRRMARRIAASGAPVRGDHQSLQRRHGGSNSFRNPQGSMSALSSER